MKLYERIIGILIFKLVCLIVLQKEIENKREIMLYLLIIFVHCIIKKNLQKSKKQVVQLKKKYGYLLIIRTKKILVWSR